MDKEQKKKIKREFGERLKCIRKECEMRQSQLASKSGMSKSFISELERGNKCPTLETIIILANALEKDPRVLIPSAHKTQERIDSIILWLRRHPDIKLVELFELASKSGKEKK